MYSELLLADAVMKQSLNSYQLQNVLQLLQFCRRNEVVWVKNLAPCELKKVFKIPDSFDHEISFSCMQFPSCMSVWLHCLITHFRLRKLFCYSVTFFEVTDTPI